MVEKRLMPNGMVLECHLNTGQPDHLNNGELDAILFKLQKVWYSNARYADPHCTL